MKREILLSLAGYAFTAACFITSPACFAADQGMVQEELMKVERAWCNATVKSDAAAVGAILADDYTDVLLTGKVANKAEILELVKTDKATVCDIDMAQVRVYGEAAIVVGRTTWKSSSGGGQHRYTDIYIRRKGRWICVASQATEIKT